MAIKNKKGMFFTLIAVTMVVAIIAFFTPNLEYLPVMSRIPTTKIRVIKAYNLMKTYKSTLIERELKSSSYFAVKQLLICINETKNFADLQPDFKEIILNSTINDGSSLETTCGVDLMSGRTIPTRLDLLSNLSETELHIFTNFSVKNITIYQSNDTSYDKFAVDLDLNIKMDAGIASWDTNTTIATVLKVAGFEDPYYFKKAGFTNKIEFSNITDWTTAQVFDHIDNMNYVYEEQAPSFLMRVEGNINGSKCCGMESLINPYTLDITSDVNWSYVDYCYYDHNCTGSKPNNKSLWNITGITRQSPSQKFYKFKLEMYHLSKYNLTEEADDRVVCEPVSACP